MAVIHRLFPEEGYGFLRTVDAQKDVYFHRDSVLHNHFDQLEISVGVRYAAEAGEKGLQATTVQIVDTPGTPKGASGAILAYGHFAAVMAPPR
jgi:cold shock CspA family protein